MITPNNTTDNRKTTLHNELHTFICSSIAIRKRLLKTEKSLKNKMLMTKMVETLERLLIANRYDNDRLMVSFFIRHSDELEEIIPGSGSSLHQKYILQFKELHKKAVEYYVNVNPINASIPVIS